MSTNPPDGASKIPVRIGFVIVSGEFGGAETVLYNLLEGLSESEQSLGRFYELLSVTRAVGYDCDGGPATECELGGYGD